MSGVEPKVRRPALEIALNAIALATVLSRPATAATEPPRAPWSYATLVDHANACRADELRPKRRDAPLRYENITDNEVREIQEVARGVVPRALVNIAGVVEGCPCEDGPDCSDQVWILAANSDATVGLLVSKIDGRWIVGPVQQWWLTYEKFQAARPAAPSYTEDQAAEAQERRLLAEFPVCARSGKSARRLGELSRSICYRVLTWRYGEH